MKILSSQLRSHIILIGFLLMTTTSLTGEEGHADKVGLQIAHYVQEQIHVMQQAQEDFVTENKGLDYEVVPPEMVPKPYLGVFGILVSPQVSISIPALVTLRIAPQLDIYWGRFMPAGMTNYIPTIRVIKTDGETNEREVEAVDTDHVF